MLPHAEEPGPAAAARRTPVRGGGPGAPSSSRSGSRSGSRARRWRSWRAAWAEASYGPGGFWSRERPADHFTTGAGVGPAVAAAVAGLAPDGVGVVVDVGAGDAALLGHLGRLLPGVALIGVDRRPRPDGLDPRVRWCVDHWDVDAAGWAQGGPDAWLEGRTAPLVVAHEWLDDLPATVAVRRAGGWRDVEVDDQGAERAGPAVADADAAWLARWWPTPVAGGVPVTDGVRAEVGLTRDAAWAGLVGAAVRRGGRALAVDYGHVRDDRPPSGSLVAYAGGRQRRPVPDGSVNLTAGVAVDALAAAGEAVGARTLALRRQADVLAEPEVAAPDDDPLTALVRRSERAALTAPGRWGGLWWLLQSGTPGPVS